MPFNGPASFNGSLNGFANLPLGDSAFTLSNTIGASYRQSASYVGTDVDMGTYNEDGYYAFMDEFINLFVNDPDWYAAHITENSTRTLSANENLRIRYRGTALEAMVGASTRMNRSYRHQLRRRLQLQVVQRILDPAALREHSQRRDIQDALQRLHDPGAQRL